MFEYFPGVVVAEPSPHTHASHSLWLEKNLLKVRNCDLECLVARYLSLAFQEALEIYTEFIKA